MDDPCVARDLHFQPDKSRAIHASRSDKLPACPLGIPQAGQLAPTMFWRTTMIRFLCLIFLLAFIAALGLFAYQNQYDVTLTFWDREITAAMPVVAGAIFFAGMLGGWTVIGLLRRSVDRLVQAPSGRRDLGAI
jgi:hypothetical protein